MKISFVIPAYNEEKLVGKCIASVQRELAEGKYDSEIIVVNNASTDNTANVARSYTGVKVVDEPWKGLTRARQAGYMASTGDLIANVDSDTMLTPGWIKTVFEEFGKDEGLVGLSGPFIYYDLSVFQRVLVRIFLTFGFVIHLFNQHILGVGAMLQGGNFVLRRTALAKVGGYDTSIEFYGEDTDIARRVSKVGKVVWTFRLPIYTSGRRLQQEGIVTMGIRYAINFFWTTFMKKPFTKEYKDLRTK